MGANGSIPYTDGDSNEKGDAMRFEETEDYREATAALVDECRKIGRGQTLSIAAIAALSGIAWGDAGWGHLTNKLKVHVEREIGITMRSVPGVGYYLMTLAEQLTEAPRDRRRRAGRQLRKAIGHLESLPVRELTAAQRMHRDFSLQMAASAKRRAYGDILRDSLFARGQVQSPRVPFGCRQPAAV